MLLLVLAQFHLHLKLPSITLFFFFFIPGIEPNHRDISNYSRIQRVLASENPFSLNRMRVTNCLIADDCGLINIHVLSELTAAPTLTQAGLTHPIFLWFSSELIKKAYLCVFSLTSILRKGVCKCKCY